MIRQIIYKLTKPRVNIIKTIILNFSTLPFKQAIRLPILLVGNWNLRSLEGNIILPDNHTNNKRIKIGVNYAGYVTAPVGTLTLQKGSKLILHKNVKISQGVHLCLYSNAELSLGAYSSLGDNVKIICSNKINIGMHTGVTWECQVLDFGTHYIEDLENKEIHNIYQSVEIGDYCWIGNRTTIMPGSRIPNDTIVASNSLLNKDYCHQGIEPFSLLGGIPVKLIRTNIFRLRDINNEIYLNKYFLDTKSAYINSKNLPIDEYKQRISD